MDRLLAKSLPKSWSDKVPGDSVPDYVLLTQHSRDVAAACRSLADEVGPIALHNATLDSEKYFNRFRLALRLNGWVQDLGKASSHFQFMVTKNRDFVQLLRHEVISALLVSREPLSEWLAPLSDVLLVSVWGAIGHHRKFDESTTPNQSPPLTVRVKNDDFAAILADMRDDFEISKPPPEFNHEIIITEGPADEGDFAALEAIRYLRRDFKRREELFTDPGERCLLALVKAFGIAADVVASAVAAEAQWANKYSIENYVQDTLKKGLTSGDLSRLIERKWVKDSGLVDCERSKDQPLPRFIPRDFQRKVRQSRSCLTLVTAGCASGKSFAAYMWAGKWCRVFHRKGRKNFRLFFCLPTTGTTTEHYKDYALESGIDDANLTHTRAKIDLQTIAETAAQEEANHDEAEAAKAALRAAQDRIESLALWGTPLVVTTTDTILGLMSNARRSIYSLPAIMNAAIVFDEIHAFDEQMFGHLLVFLKMFPQLPVLLMTASLPDNRRRAIESIRRDLNLDLTKIPGPLNLEILKRYKIKKVSSDQEVWDEIRSCLSNNGKVLWVRNQVEWANHSYENCEQLRKEFPGLEVDLYHSRFIYDHRSKRHRRVINNFKRKDLPMILVATQVAEMSLNISADLLVTDKASISALIQRLGRLNRFPSADSLNGSKLALVCELPAVPQPERPYEEVDLEKAELWVTQLLNMGRALSQKDLSEEFAKLDEGDEFDMLAAEENAVFFSGLWRTRPGLTRAEGYTLSVILQEHYDELIDCKGKPNSDWLSRHEVAIPYKKDMNQWKRVGPYLIAPGDKVKYDYDKETHRGTGARWINR